MSCYLKYLHLIQSDLAHVASGTGPHVLQDTLDAIIAATVTPDLQDRILQLIDLAHISMSSAPSYQWRRLHTDACIIRSILILLEGLTPLKAIAALDSAIIISGATGKDRLHVIHSLINDIQSCHSPPSPPFSDYPVGGATNVDRLDSAAQCVLQFENYPSLLAFQKTHFQAPFVLRGYAKEWPAMQEHPWRSANYLRSVAGAGRIVPVEVGNDYRLDDWSQRLVPWDEFLSTLDFVDQSRSNSAEVMYLAQHNLFMQFPALWADIMIPDYVYADLNSPNYTPPANDERLATNIWLGPQGTLSPAHTDPYNNMYVQMVGSKTVWLAPPETSSWMYPCAGAAFAHPAVNDMDPRMSNTTRVDVFGCRTNMSETEHPGFWKEVAPRAMNCTLTAGDMLYIPAGWWHGMRSENTSFSVSMWF